jgi:hypothetical protein
MKLKQTTISIFLSMLAIIFNTQAYGQEEMPHRGHLHPDSLIQITVSGSAIVDTSMMHLVYYLDEDGDGQADYFLDFGPFWYQPEDSLATRPNNGDNITIVGGLWDDIYMQMPLIIVYEINGFLWRDPYATHWLYMGMGGHNHTGLHYHNSCYGFSFGWMHDSLHIVSLSGVALVDTTMFHLRYFLDEDYDGLPDYILNFGPPWYEPPSGAVRTNDGDIISIVGASMHPYRFPMIIVFEINGLVWRDSTFFMHHIMHSWIYKNVNQAQQVYSTFDEMGWMKFNPGWHNQMMPDSMFCQMMEVYPQIIPDATNENPFTAYEIGIYYPDGMNKMWEGGGCGGSMHFPIPIEFNIHYTDKQLAEFNISEYSIKAKYWDKMHNMWQEFGNILLDPVSNTLSFSSNTVSNFIIITGTEILTETESDEINTVNKFTLLQNFPNPFNPITTIGYTIPKEGFVTLKVYNILGQEVAILVSEEKKPGSYEAMFDGSKLTSGVYLYQLEMESHTATKKLILMK